MLFFEDSPFANFVANAFAASVFVLWLWLFIVTASDLFRRKDMSGPGKALWLILLVVLPYVGIFAYLIAQGGGIAKRDGAQARQARDEVRNMVGFSAADELVKLDRLKAQNAISEEEYLALRRRLVA
jgi:hypothetical protein